MRVPRGRGQPALVLPGFGTDDWATAPLRKYLRSIGYDARGWGIGRNHGNVVALLSDVAALVQDLYVGSGQRVHLVGWSLGGVVAREVARERPELVAQVITFGTPVVGGPAYTVTASAYGPEIVARAVQ